jgi:hypothetical protein
MSSPPCHYIVPAGGLAPDGSRWIDSSPRFFLPVKALSRRFRRKFRTGLCELFEHNRLQFHGSLRQHASPGAFSHFLSELGQKDWGSTPSHPSVAPNMFSTIWRERSPGIWSEGAIACASDSKKFGAWDQT